MLFSKLPPVIFNVLPAPVLLITPPFLSLPFVLYVYEPPLIVNVPPLWFVKTPPLPIAMFPVNVPVVIVIVPSFVSTPPGVLLFWNVVPLTSTVPELATTE